MKKVQLAQNWFRTPTWPPLHCFGAPIWLPWCNMKTLCTVNLTLFTLRRIIFIIIIVIIIIIIIITVIIIIIRELKQRRFWATHVNRKWGLLLFICLDTTKFVLPSFFSLIKTIYPRVSTKNHCPMLQKVHFRFTSVAQKRCCLSSLITGVTNFLTCRQWLNCRGAREVRSDVSM